MAALPTRHGFAVLRAFTVNTCLAPELLDVGRAVVGVESLTHTPAPVGAGIPAGGDPELEVVL